MQQIHEDELIFGNRYDIIVINDNQEYKYNGIYNGSINMKYISNIQILFTFIDVIDYTNNKYYKKINFQNNKICHMVNEYFIPSISLKQLCWNKLSPIEIGYLKDNCLNKKLMGIY